MSLSTTRANGAITTLALNADWLTNETSTNATMISGNCVTYPWASYPYYYTYCYPYYGLPRPIKLTLSELETLREKARKDKKLKAIFSKFTDYIEITVDFE